MKKLTIFTIALLFSVVSVAPVFATRGGEPNNTHCNGVGNRNSPCQPSNNGGNGGNGGDGGNGGNVVIKDNTIKNITNLDNKVTVKPKITNKIQNDINNKINTNVKNNVRQNQEANARSNAEASNEGVKNEVVVEGDNVTTEGDKYYNVVPPSTYPLQGTTSAQVTTLFGGAGFSKDAPHAKLMATGRFLLEMRSAGALSVEDTNEAVFDVTNKLLKKVCGKKCALDRDDSQANGNSGNL